MMHQLFKAFEDAISLLQNPDLPSATRSKMLDIISDPAKFIKLQIELAVTIDAMEPFVKATYVLEGDGVLALSAYTQIHSLYGSISLEHYPNFNAVAKKLAQGNSVHEQQLVAYSKGCVNLPTTISS